MNNCSFTSSQITAPPCSLAKLFARRVADEDRQKAAAAGQMILAWHSPHVTDSEIAGIGLDVQRFCHDLLTDRPVWLEQVWERLVILLGGLAGEAAACGSIRLSAVEGSLRQGRALAVLLAGLSGTGCPWPDDTSAPGPDISRSSSRGLSPDAARIMNIAMRRARLLLLRDRFAFEALRQALSGRRCLTDGELTEVIGPRPWTF